MTAIAPSNEIGIATAMINVDLKDIRKRRTIKAANIVPSTIWLCKDFTIAFMKTESSVDISNVTPKGRLGRISLSSLSFILLIISTVLELATLTIPRPTDGRLLNLAVSL